MLPLFCVSCSVFLCMLGLLTDASRTTHYLLSSSLSLHENLTDDRLLTRISLLLCAVIVHN